MLVTATLLVFCKVLRSRPLPGHMGAGYVCPESAAVPELLNRLLVERNEEIFVFDRGDGHEYPPHPDLPDAPLMSPDH